jgi:hypothetical protein
VNWCQPHWDLLRTKIDQAGLTSLVSDTGAELSEKLTRQLGGEDVTLGSYDPLMSACMALTTFAYDAVGSDNARRVLLEGHCPICIANEVHRISCAEDGCELDFTRYFDNAVADEVERAKGMLGGTA